MRMAAFTGRTDYISAWCNGRQLGPWAARTSRAAPAPAQKTPPAVATPPPADPSETLRELTELHQRGVVTDAEFETLRADLRV
jgi:Short C-terminal domain